MENIKITVKPSLHPIVTDTFEPLIEILQKQWDELSVKEPTARFRLLTEMKISVQVLQSFIWADNWMGTYASLKGHPVKTTIESLKMCFRDDPEIQKKVLKLYKEIMTVVLTWMDDNHPEFIQ